MCSQSGTGPGAHGSHLGQSAVSDRPCLLSWPVRAPLRAHRWSCCNGKPVTVGPNQFACQRAPFFIVSLRHTEFCLNSSSGSPASLAPGFSDAVRHQPVRLVQILTFRVQVNDTTQAGAPSPVRRLLTSNRLHEVTKVVRPTVLTPHSRRSSPASLHVATPPSPAVSRHEKGRGRASTEEGFQT